MFLIAIYVKRRVYQCILKKLHNGLLNKHILFSITTYMTTCCDNMQDTLVNMP